MMSLIIAMQVLLSILQSAPGGPAARPQSPARRVNFNQTPALVLVTLTMFLAPGSLANKPGRSSCCQITDW